MTVSAGAPEHISDDTLVQAEARSIPIVETRAGRNRDPRDVLRIVARGELTSAEFAQCRQQAGVHPQARPVAAKTNLGHPSMGGEPNSRAYQAS